MIKEEGKEKSLDGIIMKLLLYGVSGRAGGRIILPGTSTSIFIDNTDMDRGDSDRIHRVSKKRRT